MKNSKSLFAVVTAILIGAATPAFALDGCKVLLCLAGPWQSIPSCVDEIEQLFRDLSGGAAFPSCSFASGTLYAPNAQSGGTASASNVWLAQWAPAPDPSCPLQYVTLEHGLRRAMYGCRYAGMIAVRVNGQLWSTTYWSMTGRSVTELSAYERALGPMQSALPGAATLAYDAAQTAGSAAAPPATAALSPAGD